MKFFLIIAMLGATAFYACNKTVEGAGPSVRQASSVTKALANTVAPINASEGQNAYSPVGRRDPFRSYLSELQQEHDQHRPERTLEPTEAFEIEQFRLTGLVTGTSQPKAMVEDPSGHGFVLHIGSRLGKSGGRVEAIDNQSVTVVEQSQDLAGKISRSSVVIRLPKTDGQDTSAR